MQLAQDVEARLKIAATEARHAWESGQHQLWNFFHKMAHDHVKDHGAKIVANADGSLEVHPATAGVAAPTLFPPAQSTPAKE